MLLPSAQLHHLLNLREELRTVFGRTLHTAVKLHGLFVPLSGLTSHLHQFSQNLVVLTGDDLYQLQLSGSATGLDFEGAKFIVCTNHQLAGKVIEDIGIIVPHKNLYISSSGYTGYRVKAAPKDSDRFDLSAFNFTAQTIVHPELSNRFFRITPQEILADGDDPVAFIAHGCPFGDQVYDVYDRKRIHTVSRTLICSPDGQPSDFALGRCRTTSEMDFNPDGLSGGPVFAAVMKGTEMELRFAGVINRAGNGIIHFIKAKHVIGLVARTFGSLTQKVPHRSID